MTNRKYPWEKWFKRKRPLTLRKGVDFNCKTHGMVQQIRNAALHHRVTVSLQVESDSIKVTLV